MDFFPHKRKRFLFPPNKSLFTLLKISMNTVSKLLRWSLGLDWETPEEFGLNPTSLLTWASSGPPGRRAP